MTESDAQRAIEDLAEIDSLGEKIANGKPIALRNAEKRLRFLRDKRPELAARAFKAFADCRDDHGSKSEANRCQKAVNDLDEEIGTARNELQKLRAADEPRIEALLRPYKDSLRRSALAAAEIFEIHQQIFVRAELIAMHSGVTLSPISRAIPIFELRRLASKANQA